MKKESVGKGFFSTKVSNIVRMVKIFLNESIVVLPTICQNSRGKISQWATSYLTHCIEFAKKWADIWNVWCQSVFSSLFFLLRMTNSKLSMIWVTLAKAPSDASVTEDLWVCLVHQLILWNKNHEWSQTNGSKWKKCLFRLNAMNYNCTEFNKKSFQF